MSRIELVTCLPDWQWTERARQEILMTGEELVAMSDFVWRVGNVAVAGFMHSNLLSPPWMWFVLAEGVTISDLIDFRRLAERIPKGTMTAVESGFAVGLKFAKFYGFVEIGEEQQHFGKTFKLLRKM